MEPHLRSLLRRLFQGEASFGDPTAQFVEHLGTLEKRGWARNVRLLSNEAPSGRRWLNVTAEITDEGRKALGPHRPQHDGKRT